MLTVGFGGTVLAWLAVAAAMRTSGPVASVAALVAGGAGLAAVYGLGMAAYMTYGSRVEKRRTRERLLDLAHAV